MNIIEQMYKEYGVEPINIAEYGSTYIPNAIKIDDEFYHPFTAEKQIELIKLMDGVTIYEEDISWNSYVIEDEGMFYEYTINYGEWCNKTFEEALAECIIAHSNKIDNSKVKEILEK